VQFAHLGFEFLDALLLGRRWHFERSAVTLAPAHSALRRRRHAADLAGNGFDSYSLRRVPSPGVEHHAHGALGDLGGHFGDNLMMAPSSKTSASSRTAAAQSVSPSSTEVLGRLATLGGLT